MCLQIKQNLKLLIGLSNSLVICLSQEARKALFKATFLFKLYIKLWHSFFEWAKPDLFFVYIWSFQTINTIFTTNQCEEMSCPSSILCQDSNPRSLEHESPPITTRPGLPPTELDSRWVQASNNLNRFLITDCCYLFSINCHCLPYLLLIAALFQAVHNYSYIVLTTLLSWNSH